MKWGSFEIERLTEGYLWLDGGAMFGVVPKVLWARRVPCDEKNRIRLATNCLLIRTGKKNVLIDTGCGHKYSDKLLDIYSIEHPTGLESELARVGLRPEDVDIVINTHLHFDHCGGNTRLEDGKLVATFPNATYVVRRDEYEAANHPSERSAASYFPHNWRPLEEAGRVQIVDSDREIVPGIQLYHTPGHTLGHASVKIESEGRTLFYLGDLCPTTAHIPLPWIMGFDLYPMTTLEVRKQVYRKAVQEEWLLLFEHDPETFSGYLREEDGKYILQPA